MSRLTHPAVLQTARWPAPRCPACCGGGGSASWSCSTAWSGREGSAPTHRTPPESQPATARRARPAETRRVPPTACRLIQREDAEVTEALSVLRWSLDHSQWAKFNKITWFSCWLVLLCCCCPSCGQLEEAGGAAFFFRHSPPPLPLSLLLFNSLPLLSSPLLLLFLLFLFLVFCLILPDLSSSLPPSHLLLSYPPAKK